MRGSPRSIMLTWANTVAGWSTSATVAAIQRQQRAALKETLPKQKRKRRKNGGAPPRVR